MEPFDDAWVNAQVTRTIEVWRDCAGGVVQNARRYRASEQEMREQAYDEALGAVEEDLRRASIEPDGRVLTRGRIVDSFARFSAKALGLEGEAIDLLTREFLPVGTELARWTRRQHSDLEMSAIIQAARNAWTACGLQPLLGAGIKLTPAIQGYSLLYPYSDNYLDEVDIPLETKLQFSRRFRCKLAGGRLRAADDRERAIWELIGLIETQYPRAQFPHVFECLLAIHGAQEQSIHQLDGHIDSDDDFLRLSVAKGGTSVLTDACLVNGELSGEESRFAFEWGVLLQLGDDLQDVKDDLRRGSNTLFSRAAGTGVPLDRLTMQLLKFSDKVGRRMDELPDGSAGLKNLLKMSWRSLIIRAVADSHEFFSSKFVNEAECCSPFRFGFLRARNDRLASRRGLYETLFEALLEDGEDEEPDSCLEGLGATIGPHKTRSVPFGRL